MFLNYCPYGYLRLIDVNDESDHVLLQAHACTYMIMFSDVCVISLFNTWFMLKIRVCVNYRLSIYQINRQAIYIVHCVGE